MPFGVATMSQLLSRVKRFLLRLNTWLVADIPTSLFGSRFLMIGPSNFFFHITLLLHNTHLSRSLLGTLLGGIQPSGRAIVAACQSQIIDTLSSQYPAAQIIDTLSSQYPAQPSMPTNDRNISRIDGEGYLNMILPIAKKNGKNSSSAVTSTVKQKIQ